MALVLLDDIVKQATDFVPGVTVVPKFKECKKNEGGAGGGGGGSYATPDFLPTDDEDTVIAALRARIAKLSAANTAIEQQSKPSLRRRSSVAAIMAQKEGLGFLDRVVSVGGWVRTVRQGKGFSFVKLYDGTCGSELQVLVPEDVLPYSTITMGSSILACGPIVRSRGREQKVELSASSCRVLGKCDAVSYPLAGKNHTLDYLRQVGHMRPRSMFIGAVSRVRNALSYATHQFFQQRQFQYVHTPLITASDCEGAGEMFQVTTLFKDDEVTDKLPNGEADYSKDFFKTPAFLTVSGQLNGEMMATALSNVYTFGPTFRAERSVTFRHLAEFWMIEPEIAWADLNENMDVAEAYLKYVIKYTLERVPADMKFLEKFEVDQVKARQKEMDKEAKAKGTFKKKKKGKAAKTWRDTPLRDRLQSIVDSNFARVKYTEAITILEEAIAKGTASFERDVSWGIDLASEHERYLCEVHFQKPTIVIDYPKEIKAFYMRANDDGKTVAAMDMLVPGVGELMGGSQREERLDVLEARVKEAGLNPEDYARYLDLRRYGTVPHSGFGAGFGRLVCYTTGINNIRDAIPFPRWLGSARY